MKLLMKSLVKQLLVRIVFLNLHSLCSFHCIKCIFFHKGCRDKNVGQILKNIIQTDYFRVSVVDDVEAVEVCGALKVCVLIKLFMYLLSIYNVLTYTIYFFVSILSNIDQLMILNYCDNHYILTKGCDHTQLLEYLILILKCF